MDEYLDNMLQCAEEELESKIDLLNLHLSSDDMLNETNIQKFYSQVPGESIQLTKDSNTSTMNAATVKTEWIDPEDEILTNDEQTNQSQFRERLKSSDPIVYTTRLDDMFIFNKDFSHMDIDEIVENIILESKPKFKQLPNPNLNPPYVISPFYKLVEHIRTFNELSNRPIAYSKSSNISPICYRELYVALVDCKIKPGSTVKVRLHDGEYKVVKVKAPKQIKKRKLDQSLPNCIIYPNHVYGSDDMYFINKQTNVISAFCSSNLPIPEDELPCRSLIMASCCWVSRERSIKSIMGWPENVISTRDFMREPHDCPPGKCYCCCGDRNTHNASNRNLENPNESHTSRILPLSLSYPGNSKDNTCIDKAFCYTRKKSEQFNRNSSNTEFRDNLPVDIQILNKYTQNLESYHIQRDGNIKKHVEVNICDVESLGCFHTPTFFQNAETLCCWMKRDLLLQEMQSKYSDSVINIIRRPHDCDGVISGEECTCCCKPSTLRLKQLPDSGKLDVSIKLVHAQNYVNQNFSYRNKTTRTLNPKNRNVVLRKAIVNITPRTKPKLKSKQRKQPKKTLQVQPKKSVSNVAPIKPLTQIQQNQSVLPNKQPVLNVQSENQDRTVNSLVESILNRFQDIRLNITPSGEITAELKTPINEISTSELKVLSSLLKHVKEQVKILNLNPVQLKNFASSVNMLSAEPGLSSVSALLDPITLASNATSESPTTRNEISTVNTIAEHDSKSSISSNLSMNPIKPSLSEKQVLTSNPLNSASDKPKSMSNLYQFYTEISVVKANEFARSFASFINSRSLPLIDELYSLCDQDQKKKHLPSKDSTSHTETSVSKANGFSRSFASFIKSRSLPQIDEIYSLCGDQDQKKKHLLSKGRNSQMYNSGVKRKYTRNKEPKRKKTKDTQKVAIASQTVSNKNEKLILSNASLKDLVSAPFVPPVFLPNSLMPGPCPPLVPLTNAAPAVVCSDPLNIQVGPAFSLIEVKDDPAANVIFDEVKVEDECILGF